MTLVVSFLQYLRLTIISCHGFWCLSFLFTQDWLNIHQRIRRFYSFYNRTRLRLHTSTWDLTPITVLSLRMSDVSDYESVLVLDHISYPSSYCFLRNPNLFSRNVALWWSKLTHGKKFNELARDRAGILPLLLYMNTLPSLLTSFLCSVNESCIVCYLSSMIYGFLIFSLIILSYPLQWCRW